jgi:transglutaminase-like putative cysteine protease
MIYDLIHSTEYQYASASSQCHNLVHLQPRSIDQRQHVLTNHFVIEPQPHEVLEFSDYFGNHAHSFSIDERHTSLKITSHATVDVEDRQVVFEDDLVSWESIAQATYSDLTPEGLSRRQFCCASPMIPRLLVARQTGQAVFQPNRPIVQTIRSLNELVHESFVYDGWATAIETPLAQVFEMKRGVCQDLSHAMIAIARSYGLAARYVSGYLRTFHSDEGSAFIGADQSHAWVSIFAGPYGWIDVDPTNKIEVLQDHVTIGWGRDFSDVTPIKGLFTGTSHLALNVAVTLRPKP